MNVVMSRFARAWKSRFNVSSVLTITPSDGAVFGASDLGKVVRHGDLQDLRAAGQTFGLVVGELPLGMKIGQMAGKGRQVKAPENWLYVLRGCNAISQAGHGIFMVEPNAFVRSHWTDFEEELTRAGLFLHGVFRTPGRFLEGTAVTPMFIVTARARPTGFFVAELVDEIQAEVVVENFAAKKAGTTLLEGVVMQREEFSTFHRFTIRQQIRRLETQYKAYEERSLGELAETIVLPRSGQSHLDHENAVYVPKVGNSPVVCSLGEMTLKHHNYYQVVLKEDVSCAYVAAFFRSDLGKLILSSLVTSSVIPHMNRRDLEDAIVALPCIEEQRRVASTLSKLAKLQSALDEFRGELALNPTSSSSAIGKLDSMMEVIGALTLADKIRSLARVGESKTLEFKETLSLDVRKGSREKYIEEAALKTIVAFLNTDGGVLLVGVDDDGGIPGLGREIGDYHRGKHDNLLKHVKNLIKDKIGEAYYPFIEFCLVDVDDCNVLHFDCLPSRAPCFLYGKDFYVRTNPATDKLEGPKLVAYVDAHFSKDEARG